MNSADNLTYREIDAGRDIDSLENFDASFTTDRIYRLEKSELCASFVEEIIPQQLTKTYDLSGIRDAVAESDFGLVAEIGEEIAGFMTMKFESWNRRAWITHLYVIEDKKGRGLGTRLVEEAMSFARRR